MSQSYIRSRVQEAIERGPFLTQTLASGKPFTAISIKMEFPFYSTVDTSLRRPEMTNKDWEDFLIKEATQQYEYVYGKFD